MTHNELADLCESAEGPSRELDLFIMRYLENIGGPTENALHYTASVDAALTLVPSGWQWTVTDYQGAAPAIAVLGNKLIIRNAATPGLALCAASLRARAMMETANG